MSRTRKRFQEGPVLPALRVWDLPPDLQEENPELGTFPYRKSVCPGRPPYMHAHVCHACVRVCVFKGWFLPTLRSSWVSRPLHPFLPCLSGPSPTQGPAASRQPWPSVVADVWLCHGNARTGCTFGSQQGQTHAPRLPSHSPAQTLVG